jgi:RNA polymerase sigma factor
VRLGFGREPDDVEALVRRAQRGDAAARDNLLRRLVPFVARLASEVAGRWVELGSDDEMSVGLMALDEAIDGFRAERGSFWAFARTVVRRRLIDARRRDREQTVPLSDLEETDEEGHVQQPAADRIAERLWQAAQEEAERREEIFEFVQTLSAYGLKLVDLVADCPRRDDARRRALDVARLIARDPVLARHVLTERTLPLKRLEAVAGASRKTLERHRRYILAATLVYLNDWPLIRTFLDGLGQEDG